MSGCLMYKYNMHASMCLSITYVSMHYEGPHFIFCRWEQNPKYKKWISEIYYNFFLVISLKILFLLQNFRMTIVKVIYT